MGMDVYIERTRNNEREELLHLEGRAAEEVHDYTQGNIEVRENEHIRLEKGVNQFYYFLKDMYEYFDDKRYEFRLEEDMFNVCDLIVEHIMRALYKVIEELIEDKNENKEDVYEYYCWV